MKSIKLLLGIICLASETMHAMEKKPQERLVKLTDKDKKEIIILPRRIADMSSTVSNILMEELPEEEIGKPIPIPTAVPSLSAIAIILTEIDKNLIKRSQHEGLVNIKNKEIFDEYNGGYLAKEVQPIVDEYLEAWYKAKNYSPDQKEGFTADLIRLSSFLDLPYLTNAFANRFIYANEKTYQEIIKMTSEERSAKLKEIAEKYEIGPVELLLIEKHFYLRNFDVKDELSIADYIAEHGQPEMTREYVLELTLVNITNLDGIELLENKETIQELKLSNNMFTEITAGAFKEFINLKILSLPHNKLTKISAEAFKGLTNLKELYLSANMLIEIPTKVFNELINLEILFLNSNKLTKIPEEAFKKLANLKQLDLGNNNLTEISTEVFNGLINLEMLFLNDNKLTKIPEEVFKDLIKLELLFLFYNQITEVSEQAFKGLIKLKEIDLEDNELSLFSTASLEGLKLERLKLRKNKFNKETKTIIRKYCNENNIYLEI